jgi:DNA-binding response OmpR family regulator
MYGDLTAVAVYIRRLRQKIEEDPASPRYLQTIHGRGYRFNPDAVKG